MLPIRIRTVDLDCDIFSRHNPDRNISSIRKTAVGIGIPDSVVGGIELHLSRTVHEHVGSLNPWLLNKMVAMRTDGIC